MDDQLLALVREATANSVMQSLANAGALHLGHLRDNLDMAPDEAIVCWDTEGFPGEPNSYRGYYDHLAFEPGAERITVGDFKRVIDERVMGKTFIGYKGGDYVMDHSVPVWCAEYGRANGRLLCGTKVVENGKHTVFVLRTTEEGWM